MSKVIDADNMRYTKRHEWVMLEDDVVTVGITDYAQGELDGEVSFIDMPVEGVEISAGEEAATVESQNDTLSVLSPMDGTVVEVNQLLEDNPELVSSDPYGDGYLFRLEVTDLSMWRDLLTAEEYEEYVGE
ncbi:MAG: glycine cleavage system protein GcvH [Planctomycetaceae bacterium]|nr:glycine cleavage system protein GcvH [Planctomycetaceae bacterium]